MKPDKDEFKKKFEETDGARADKVKKLSVEYGKTPRTIYRWLDELIDAVPDVEDDYEDEEKTWDEWVENYRDPDEEYPAYEQKLKMKGRDILVACVSDTHFGSKALRKTLKKLDRDMKTIKEREDTFMVFVGDIIDYGPASPRGLGQDQQLKYKNQLAMANAFVNEFGESILAMASGCHSHFTYNLTGEFPERKLAEKTYGGIFIGDGGMLDIKLGDCTYKIFMSHKLRGGSKKNPAGSLLNIAMESMDFDIGVTAHKHTPAVSTRPLREKQIHMINCGSYKGMDLYARKNGYAPVLNSTPCFYISNKYKKIISFLNLQDGIDYMELVKCYEKVHS